MKLNTLEKVYNCLKNDTGKVILPVQVCEQALQPLERMMPGNKM